MTESGLSPFLVYVFSIKRDTHGAKEESRIFVGGGGRVDHDVAARNHFWGIPDERIKWLESMKSRPSILWYGQRKGGSEGRFILY